MPGLHAVVDAHAARHPGSPAAEDGGGTWTYAELRDASLLAAAVLRAAGLVGSPAPDWDSRPVAPRPLALVLPRGREWYALCLAGWRLGIPVVALSEDMPDKVAERDRAARAVAELKPLAAVLDGNPEQLLPGLPIDCRIWQAAEFWASARLLAEGGLLSSVAASAAPSSVSPASVLLYCYTGGTTKHSKCVVVTHAMALWEMEHYEAAVAKTITRGDRVLCYTSAYWGAAAFGQMDIALAFGACCVFAASEPGVDFIARAVEKYQVSVLGTVPSQLRGAYPGGPSTKPDCLRVIITWGEKFPVKLSRPWRAHCAAFELLIASEYWLALHTDCSTWHDSSDGQEKHVYRALQPLDMLLVDQDGTRLPLHGGAEGQVGEFFLSGPTVSPGYLGADGRVGSGAENEASYRVIDGKRYFRTKDRLLLAPGGGFVYCGRADSLAKRGGTWVDLEAMEVAVGALPGVASAAVLAGDEVDVFVSLEPPRLQREPLCRLLDRVRRAAGGACRLHARSELPLHPATAKVDRRRLRSELDEVRGRQAQHASRLAQLHRRMLLSYCAWYPVALFVLLAPGWVRLSFRDIFVGLLLRLCLLPYLWAALLHTLLRWKPERSFYGWPLGPPDLLLLLAGALPLDALAPAWALACAALAWRRDADRAAAVCLLGLAALFLFPADVVLDFPVAAVRALLGGLAATLLLPRRFGFYAGLPVTFYVILPKWLLDDWQWRCRCHSAHLRRYLLRHLVLAGAPEWDGSWQWSDARNTAYWSTHEQQSNLRLRAESRGYATSVDFVQPVRPAVLAAQNGHAAVPAAARPAGAGGTPASALEALVERAGGSPQALGAMDSLQAITLAELIRKELGPAVSVAEVLQCADAAHLAAKVEAAAAKMAVGCGAVSAEELSPETLEGLPDGDGSYRVYTMAFSRMPVDWMVRYIGPGHLDLEALQRATDRLVARHSALRTVQSPDEPMRETMDRAAALWQLLASTAGARGGLAWRLASRLGGRALFECWPRTVLRPAAAARLRVKVPQGLQACDQRWESATDDDYVHSVIRSLTRDHRWPFDIIVVPLYKGQPAAPPGAKDMAEVAVTLPPESVSWYIYCGICHAYSDGASGQALFGDLLRFYAEETGQAQRQVRAEVPEQLALLQRRLRSSLRGRTPGQAPDPNNDIFHEIICEDWGKRVGLSSRLFLRPAVISALRSAALDVLGCGVDVAWLTAVLGALFRLFPEQRCILLSLKVACRDGPGELQMVGFLSEQRLFPVDVGDPETSTLLDLANTIGAARRERAWRAPVPYEAGLTVFVNIVSAMVDGLPSDFRHVVRPAATPSVWRGTAYCHLNLRIDQVSAQEWDFRLFHWDGSWGWEWIACFADALGATIADMAVAPTAPLMRPPPGGGLRVLDAAAQPAEAGSGAPAPAPAAPAGTKRGSEEALARPDDAGQRAGGDEPGSPALKVARTEA